MCQSKDWFHCTKGRPYLAQILLMRLRLHTEQVHLRDVGQFGLIEPSVHQLAHALISADCHREVYQVLGGRVL